MVTYYTSVVKYVVHIDNICLHCSVSVSMYNVFPPISVPLYERAISIIKYLVTPIKQK